MNENQFAALASLFDEDGNYIGSYFAFLPPEEVGRAKPVDVIMEKNFEIDSIIGFPYKLQGTNYQLRYVASVESSSTSEATFVSQSAAESSKSKSILMTKDFCIGCGELDEADCRETDSGYDLANAGYVTFDSLQKRVFDYCFSSNKLMEVSCRHFTGANPMRVVGADKKYWGKVVDCTSGCNQGECGGTASSQCGNGIINSGEECDGVNLNGKTCSDFGFDEGTLKCTPTSGDVTSKISGCFISTSGCFDTPECGNGICDVGETSARCVEDCSSRI